jgi:hypothetical protein
MRVRGKTAWRRAWRGWATNRIVRRPVRSAQDLSWRGDHPPHNARRRFNVAALALAHAFAPFGQHKTKFEIREIAFDRFGGGERRDGASGDGGSPKWHRASRNRAGGQAGGGIGRRTSGR